MAISRSITRNRAGCARSVAAGVVLMLLLASCSPAESEDAAGAAPSGSASGEAANGSAASPSAPASGDADASGTTPAGEAVAEREEPLVTRVEYPVEGPSDPTQNWGDLYLPAGRHEAKSVSLVVLIHGGSWQDVVGADSFDAHAQALVDRGMAVYNIEYRRVGSGGGWPTTFTDVASALDFIPALSEDYPEFTTDDELVVGYSAGAQLAAWAGSRGTAEEHELGANPSFVPTRVVTLAGPLDITYLAAHGDDRIARALGGSPSQVAERYSDVDPIQNVDPALHVVAIHGTTDAVVPAESSERYVDAVREAGGHATLHLIDGADHGAVLSPTSEHYDDILEIIAHASSAPLDQVGETS